MASPSDVAASRNIESIKSCWMIIRASLGRFYSTPPANQHRRSVWHVWLCSRAAACIMYHFVSTQRRAW